MHNKRKSHLWNTITVNFHGQPIQVPVKPVYYLAKAIGYGDSYTSYESPVKPPPSKRQKISPIKKQLLRGSGMKRQAGVAMDTHGDGCDVVDPLFNRDAEDESQQKAAAGALWTRAPRIYDDEIIVRMPLVLTMNKDNPTSGAQPLYFNPGLATAISIPNVQVATASWLQLNNIYAPWPTDTTRRPRGYAWYSQLYNYYQVLETRWTYTVTAMNDLLQTTAPTTTDIPLTFAAVTQDTSRTDWTTSGSGKPAAYIDLLECAMNNGADKSAIWERPAQITWHNGPGNQPTKITFSGTWTPAKFDDLQIDITRQPMTAVGASPNWLNHLDLYCINWNTAQPENSMYYKIDIFVEFLVHFKKVNMSKYRTAN